MDELTRIAVVGTSQHAAASTIDLGHAAEALLANLAVDDREQVFLLRAGARAIFEHCGRMARADVVPLPPCPPETRPCAPPQVVGCLQNAMASAAWELCVEFLQHLHGSGLLLPPELLPQALAVSNATVRQHLLPVLGERGRWLSSFNDRWSWAAVRGDACASGDRQALAQQWEEGTLAQRCEALRTLRQLDPEEARRWLEASIDQEKAEHRALLLAPLETGLAAPDEALLEARLDDRSEQVRRAAASLLARLPASALGRRMQERAEAMLTAQRAGILWRKLTLRCQPPEEIDKTWERDGIPVKVPAGRGKRAVWAEAVLSAVPPSLWSQGFGHTPGALIAAIGDDAFSQAVLVGWTQAAAAFAACDQGSAAWLQPLWEHWCAVEQQRRDAHASPSVQEHLLTLLKAMPDPESALRPVVQTLVAEASEVLLGLLPFLPCPWSASFGLQYLSAVRTVLQRSTGDRASRWGSSLRHAGRALPRATFAIALTPCEVAEAPPDSWAREALMHTIDQFTATIRTRKSFYDEVARA